MARSGRMMVPYLVDPNAAEGEAARAGMFESADIVRHLETLRAPRADRAREPASTA